jgi:leucyl-tRNA synthetase
LSEELWTLLGHSGSIHHQDYPQHDEKHLIESSVSYPICINGKKRGIEDIPVDMSQKDVESMVISLEYVQKWTEGKKIKKVIIVTGRMINIVI